MQGDGVPGDEVREEGSPPSRRDEGVEPTSCLGEQREAWVEVEFRALRRHRLTTDLVALLGLDEGSERAEVE